MRHSPTRRDALVALCTSAYAGTSPARQTAEQDTFSGFPGTQVRFASVEAGRSLLTADDEWMAATGDFQRQAVMGRGKPVPLEEFARWNGDAVRPWDDAQRSRWRRALEALAPAFTALRIPLPSQVELVTTNGQESANAPYTRANAVVLPGAAPALRESDAQLMAHELWHVAARHSPATASRLYAEIGFQPMPTLRFPARWQPLRIANPDAPNNAHAMRLEVAGRRPWVTPVLVASRTELRHGETFFDVMEVRLLEVRPGEAAGGASTAVVRDGQPVWHRLDADHDYLRQLGGNTRYVIHHEEVIADNVALLAAGGRARNPALLKRLQAALLAA